MEQLVSHLRLPQIMYKVHTFEFAPILVGARMRYILELPINQVPRVFKTMTTDMRAILGEVVDIKNGRAKVILSNRQICIGNVIDRLIIGGPCVVMEKINVRGNLEYMVGSKNILNGNQNFVNFGVPNGRHIRIDIYNGESEIIE